MNIPGIFKIEKIAFDSVSLPVLKSRDTISISDFITESMEEIIFIGDTAGCEVERKKNDAGTYFDLNITFLMEGYDETSLADLSLQNTKPHIYVITEKSGLKYLIGFDYTPFPRFSYAMKTDPSGKGGRSTSCKIEWQTTVFPVYVT
jgi:hypothetical protein